MKKKTKIIYFGLAILILIHVCFLFVLEAKQKDKKDDNDSYRQVVTADSAQTTCYDSPKYYIITRDVPDGVGTDFLIKYKSNPNEKLPCKYIFKNGDLEIKNEWAEYYSGLKKDFLILYSTTGPGPDGLTIWDLKKRERVFGGSWSDSEESNDTTLVYWLETGEATEGNCPRLKEWESEGLEGAI